MLCDICLAIFAVPRKLSYGTYYPWGHSSASFAKARKEGCYLCNIVWENRSYSDPFPDFDRDFPRDCTYAFKLLNPQWARSGLGSKWLVAPDPRGDDWGTDISKYLSEVDKVPMADLTHLLETEADELFTKPALFWMVIDFYCPGPRIVIPLDIVRDDLEDMAQDNQDQQDFTGSTENLRLACAWLDNCLENHEQCRPNFEDESWLPTRLLYVGTLDTPTVRLVSTLSLSENVPYAALSHCWGTNKEFVLTSTLLQSYETEIRTSNVSATLRDAFHTTRSIGLQYLWVDCLCIIQDDQEDWARESATMSKVYGLSTCTIAATLGGNGDGGCFTTRNQFGVRPCKIPNPFDKDSRLFFYARSQYLGEIYKREVKESPWYSRGWVFQERTLSPRLLIFGKTQMLWACQKLHAAETWPCGATSDDYIDRFESFEVDKSRLQTLLERDRIISPWDTTWYTFIQDYTKSHLTRMSDRLIALQGLTSHIASVTDRRYCAGLWIDQTLPLSLLWNASSPETQRSKEYRAPTWSWASMDGPIKFKCISHQLQTTTLVMIDLHGTEDLPYHQRHISRVPLANLTLSGRLSPVRLVSISRMCPLRLLRTTSTVHPKNESIAVSRYNFLREFMRWCDVIFLLAWEKFVPALALCFRNPIVHMIIFLFVGSILLIIGIKSRIDMWLGVALTVAGLLKTYLVIWYRTSLTDLIENWFSRTFTSPVDSPSEPTAPLPVGPLYADCTIDTPLRYCNLDAFCLPILRWKKGGYEGLILKPAARGEGYYERVGTFTQPNPQVTMMLDSTQVSFILT